jgi:hypothetical protein
MNADKTNHKLSRRWRRKQLADLWNKSERSIDRMRADGRLGEPFYIGRTPLWTDEQREAAERGDVSEAA